MDFPTCKNEENHAREFLTFVGQKKKISYLYKNNTYLQSQKDMLIFYTFS
ncbi:uncharacterized protein J3R85_012945 [Psidium guajava]|nr:uncharacterized protein J3R85_012945 [Psidium guajava]